MEKRQPTQEKAQELYLKAGEVFHPATPIQTQELFAGRLAQLSKVADAVLQTGLHVVLYGERGVGKTSLANILAPVLEQMKKGHVVAKVNCDGTDSFGSIWKKAVQSLELRQQRPGMGFTASDVEVVTTAADLLGPKTTPHDILRLLSPLAFPLVCVFDEFDRFPRREASVFTDLIKTMADYGLPHSLVLVGVADTVAQLVEDHASVERALMQVHLPRMTEEELRQILDKASDEMGVQFAPEAVDRIVRVSQGLPHYTHLLGRDAVRAALDRRSLQVTIADVSTGAQQATEDAQETIKRQYHEATRSGRKDALFEEVLLACALASKDELSFFQAADVVEPMSTIMGKQYQIPSFARHLKAFCEPARGAILERTGTKRRFRYRFTSPLMEPYVVMRGLATGRLEDDVMRRFGGGPREE